MNFLLTTYFKLLSRIEAILVSDFSKLIISFMGGHCDSSPWAPRNLATPLTICTSQDHSTFLLYHTIREYM
jgi:hypothetical protein